MAANLLSSYKSTVSFCVQFNCEGKVNIFSQTRSTKENRKVPFNREPKTMM